MIQPKIFFVIVPSEREKKIHLKISKFAELTGLVTILLIVRIKIFVRNFCFFFVVMKHLTFKCLPRVRLFCFISLDRSQKEENEQIFQEKMKQIKIKRRRKNVKRKAKGNVGTKYHL